MTRLKTCCMESKQIWLMHIIILNLGLSRACSTYHLISVKLHRLLIIVCLAWCQASLVEVCLLRHASLLPVVLQLGKNPDTFLQVLEFINLNGVATEKQMVQFLGATMG